MIITFKFSKDNFVNFLKDHSNFKSKIKSDYTQVKEKSWKSGFFLDLASPNIVVNYQINHYHNLLKKKKIQRSNISLIHCF